MGKRKDDAAAVARLWSASFRGVVAQGQRDDGGGRVARDAWRLGVGYVCCDETISNANYYLVYIIHCLSLLVY